MHEQYILQPTESSTGTGNPSLPGGKERQCGVADTRNCLTVWSTADNAGMESHLEVPHSCAMVQKWL